MKSLSQTWFAEGTVDFEIKKYELLGYLQQVKSQFGQILLYPPFAEVIMHYNNLVQYRERKQGLDDNFPQKLSGIDLQNLKLLYQRNQSQHDELTEIDDIIDFSIPMLLNSMEEGRGIYDFIDARISIDPIGLLPLYRDEGYLLVQSGKSHEVKAFNYKVTIFEDAGEKYRGIHTDYVCSFTWGITNNFEQMKLSLIKEQREMPNPATFSVLSAIEAPEKATLIPIAKRKFVRYLAKTG